MTVRVVFPLVPNNVIGYVPGAVVVAEPMVRDAVPATLIEVDERDPESPLTSDMPSRFNVTVPLEFRGVAV